MKADTLKPLLDAYYHRYNQSGFIEHDPISVPHRFTGRQDIEIAGFFSAILSWGNRKSIINSCNKLMERMDHAPYQFVCHYTAADLKQLIPFVHRTFQSTDLLFILEAFKEHFQMHSSLEPLFIVKSHPGDIEQGLIQFHRYLFTRPYAPIRSRKHIPTPVRKSACKRLNMFLRWMVRTDPQGVDFGIWKNISPGDLICPLDVHVLNTAYVLGLISRNKSDWKTATELTQNLKLLDPQDPVKYDFALFGMGLEQFARTNPLPLNTKKRYV